MTDPTEEAAMPLDRSALDAGTDAFVDGGVITDSDDPYGYHAKRWLEYGASGSGDATNQVCCKTGRRKALRLCQLVG